MNGKDCPECKHAGYRQYTESENRPCPARRRYRFGGFAGAGWICPCHGTGLIEGPRRTIYHRCVKCNGTGEVEMFNPVIIKGSLR